jgi:hypothetical protein
VEEVLMPPFVLCLLDSGEVLLFPDLLTLETGIEATDVANREYLAYDSLGCVVNLTVDSLGAPRAILSTVQRASDLREWILDKYGAFAEISDVQTLPEMISSLKEVYRYDDSRR